GRRSLDFSLEAALWNSRRAGAGEDRIHPIARLHTAHELGCIETGGYGQARHIGHLDGMRISGKGVGLFSWGFALGALFISLLLLIARGPAGPARISAQSTVIGMPIASLRLTDIHDTFNEGRSSGKPHAATDI